MTVDREVLKGDLDSLINLFGENGERWIQGSLKETLSDTTGEYGFCLLGGVGEVLGPQWMAEEYVERQYHLLSLLWVALPKSVTRNRNHRKALIHYNDNRTWPTIKKLLLKAKEILE